MSDEIPTAADPVGFIGLGQIGGPMAARLVDWPGGLVVCDVAPEACAPLVDAGATAVATPAEVAAAGATVISVMVRDDVQVRQVLTGDDGILAAATPGTVVAVHSTIGADTAVELAAVAADLQVAVIDAPVSGGFMGAHEGTLALLIGGDADAVERCRAPFELMATLIVRFGPIGSGTRAKIARNLVTFASYAVVAESQRIAEAAGLSLQDLGEVVRHSDRITGGPGAIWIRTETGALADDDPLRPIMAHTRALGEKDLQLAVALAAELGVDAPFTALAGEALAAGLGVPHDDPTDEEER